MQKSLKNGSFTVKDIKLLAYYSTWTCQLVVETNCPSGKLSFRSFGFIYNTLFEMCANKDKFLPEQIDEIEKCIKVVLTLYENGGEDTKKAQIPCE
jgi:hypothetical protein